MTAPFGTRVATRFTRAEISESGAMMYVKLDRERVTRRPSQSSLRDQSSHRLRIIQFHFQCDCGIPGSDVFRVCFA
jgi:hypothetical protein